MKTIFCCQLCCQKIDKTPEKFSGVLLENGIAAGIQRMGGRCCRGAAARRLHLLLHLGDKALGLAAEILGHVVHGAADCLREHPFESALPCDLISDPPVCKRFSIGYFTHDLSDTIAESGACQMNFRKEPGITTRKVNIQPFFA